MQHKRIDACSVSYRGRLLVVGGYEYDTGLFHFIHIQTKFKQKAFVLPCLGLYSAGDDSCTYVVKISGFKKYCGFSFSP